MTLRFLGRRTVRRGGVFLVAVRPSSLALLSNRRIWFELFYEICTCCITLCPRLIVNCFSQPSSRNIEVRNAFLVFNLCMLSIFFPNEVLKSNPRYLSTGLCLVYLICFLSRSIRFAFRRCNNRRFLLWKTLRIQQSAPPEKQFMGVPKNWSRGSRRGELPGRCV